MRKTNKTSLRRAVSLGLCAALLLTACGGTKTTGTGNVEKSEEAVPAESSSSPPKHPYLRLMQVCIIWRMVY